MAEETRQPRSEEDYAQMIMQALGATTMALAYQRVSELLSRRALVSLRQDGQIEVSQDLTVGTAFAVIRAIESRPIR